MRRLERYEVTVEGYGVGWVHAVSRACALGRAFRSDAFNAMKFSAFLKIAKARRAGPPADDGYAWLRGQYPDAVIPKPGERICAEGLTGTVLPALGPVNYVVFQPDGQEREAFVHPASVRLAEAV